MCQFGYFIDHIKTVIFHYVPSNLIVIEISKETYYSYTYFIYDIL